MSKWLRRGFGGGSSTPTSIGGGAIPTHINTNGGRAPQDAAMQIKDYGNGAPDASAAAVPQAYYDQSSQNGSSATKSRSNRTSGSSGGPHSNPATAPVGQHGDESIHAHPPKVTRHVRTPSDPARSVWGATPNRGATPRDAAPPAYHSNNELAQPPPPGTTSAIINGNNNYNHSNNFAPSAFLPPSDPNTAKHIDNFGDHPSSQLSNPQGGSIPRRPAYLLHRDLIIGKGSYGQVCIASRGEAEGGKSGKRKKFACKCVMLRSDPKYIAKLQEEVNVLRELRGHDNVIRLYDVFCVENELFIITELGRGGDLFHLLTTHPKHGVTESYAAKTVAQMLSAVAFLHSRQICHRDLKLENWVLESGKDVWSPLKLIDFGLSTHFTPGHRLSRVVGSSYYVAPEVLKKSYTEACDLWSLGVIVYMLLSGAPPFYGRTDEAIKASIINGEYTFPHELFRDVSDDAMAFVATLLSYNVEYRYTSEQALSHTWLSTNCDPELLYRAKEGAKGRHPGMDRSGGDQQQYVEPMQL